MNYSLTSCTYHTINASLILKQFGKESGIKRLKLNVLLTSRNQLCAELFTCVNELEAPCMVSFTSTFFGNASPNKILLDDIYLLLSLSNVAKDKILFFFIEGELGNLKKCANSVSEYLQINGVVNVKMPVFVGNRTTGKQLSSECVLYTVKSYGDDLTSESLNTDENVIIILTTPLNEHYWDTVFTDESNELLKLLTSYNKGVNISHHLTKETLESESKLWRKRAMLYQEFVSISKAVQEKEYYEIVDWYNKEYESLPLWYKQFGHIIKVLMGKRSFRSLFDDNVKKYKD